jgi:hypothetical protein
MLASQALGSSDEEEVFLNMKGEDFEGALRLAQPWN